VVKKSSFSSFSDVLAHWASATPEATAYHFVENDVATAVDYVTLAREVAGAAEQLRRHTRAGDRVLVMPAPGRRFVTIFLAALHCGVVPVPSYPASTTKHLARLRAIALDATPVAVVAEAAALALLPAGDPVFDRLNKIEAADLVDGRSSEAWAPCDAELAFLQYTSGSTSAPKGVTVTHGNLVHNEALIAAQMGITGESVILSWLPPYHDMGLVGGVLQPLFSGCPGVLTPTMEFLQQPMRWLRLVSRFRATVSGGPDFAFELCARRYRPDREDDLNLSSWQVAFTGSEPVRPQTLDTFADRFADRGFRRSAWFPCYGLAETTLFVSGGPVPAEPVVDAAGHVGCGAVSDALPVRVVGADGAAVSDGEVGEIVVGGDSVSPGYWPDQRAGSVELPGEGTFLRTGDLGVLRDGELYVAGRLKDVLIIRGRNHYPQDVESCAERSHELVRLHGVIAFAEEDRLVVVAEVFHRPDPGALAAAKAAIRAAVAQELGLHVHTVTPVRAMALPRTANGKLQRRECRRRFLAGEFVEVGT